jgi:hypothetical protein
MVKYIKSAVVICAVCLVTSCGKSTKSVQPETLSSDFSQTAEITYDGYEYKAEFRRSDSDLWECEFTYPESIEGLKITASGETCLLSFGDISYSADPDALPDSGIMPLVTEAVDMLIEKRDLSCSLTDSGTVERGTVCGAEFTALVKDGKVISLTVADNFTAEFT